jgi:photosystem II stability/assembly factor-like uncharacterized protein
MFMRRTGLPALALLALILLAGADVLSQTDPRVSGPTGLLRAPVFRNLGPARQNGRVLHVAVDERRPSTFYVVPSTGGLWKTTNNGTTFESVLPDKSMVSIGHAALAPSNPDIVWVGTGDAASGRIPLRGFGVWKSTDAGRTWAHMGLTETRHIGRIAIHPRNPDIVYVAATGYHFSNGPDRGLYKTTDGGRTWARILFKGDHVGVVDVVLNPKKPDIVFAVTYDKQRIPWNFDEGGPETGIYKSDDAGKTWRRLAGGLPTGRLARSGLAIYPKDPQIMYAVIDNQNLRPQTTTNTPALGDVPATADDPQATSKPAARRPIGGEVYRSEDAGATWTKMNAPQESIGGGKWYGWIYIDPNNDKTVYVPNVSFYRSLDGGKTWGKKGPENLARSFHVDYHAFWIDPSDSSHLILGSDGGLAVSWDFGATWDVFDHLPLAQYYATGVDMEEPYNIYGGLQDNGSVKVPSNGPRGSITRDDWRQVGGGDGMMNVVDPDDSRWLYNESQNGAIQRVDQRTGTSRSIRPAPPRGGPAYRFNWTAPIHLSPHNSRIVYLGSQVLLRSLNRGDDWREISPDLTTNDPVKLKGNIEFCTLTTISESPVTPGVIWVGSDDGKVQLTRDGGGAWIDRTAKLASAGGPADFYVTRVFASPHKEATAFVTKAGWHRDVYAPFVFRTDDYGETWTALSAGLPEGTVYAFAQDRKNADLLFVGTEMGVFATLDGGKSWIPFGSGLPPSALVHDLLIHPRENDLVVATHGRGLFVADIAPLQEATPKLFDEEVHLFAVEPRIQWPRVAIGGSIGGDRQFVAPNEPTGLVIKYLLKSDAPDKVTVRITDPYGELVAALDGIGKAGQQTIVWDFRRTAPGAAPGTGAPAGSAQPPPSGARAPVRLAPPGEYVVVLEVGKKTWSKRAVVRPAPERD